MPLESFFPALKTWDSSFPSYQHPLFDSFLQRKHGEWPQPLLLPSSLLWKGGRRSTFPGSVWKKLNGNMKVVMEWKQSKESLADGLLGTVKVSAEWKTWRLEWVVTHEKSPLPFPVHVRAACPDQSHPSLLRLSLTIYEALGHQPINSPGNSLQGQQEV